MSVLIVTLSLAALVSILLAHSGERCIRKSAAIWIAFAWLWFASSRNPAMWLNPHGMGGREAGSAYDQGNSFDRNILTGLMLAGVIVLAKRSRRTIAFLRANWPMVLFFLYCGLSVAWSSHPDISIKRWFRGLGDVVMVMVILTETDWGGAFQWVYLRLACILVPLSVVFFRWFPGLGRSYSIHDGHVSITGVTDDKNLLGAICMLFSLVVASHMIEVFRVGGPRSKQLLIGYGSIVALAIYVLYVANSATATATLIEGSGVLFLTSMRRISGRSKSIHLIVATVLGFTAFNLFGGSSLLEMFGRNSSLTGRTELWTLCLSLVRDPWIGTGYESFWLGWRLETMWNYIQGVNQAHNGYLEIYLNLGWVGVALLVTLLLAGYRNIVRAIRRREPTASLRLAFFVVACICNCTEAGFKMMHPMWIALLIVSAAWPVRSVPREPAANREPTFGKSPETPEFSDTLASQWV